MANSTYCQVSQSIGADKQCLRSDVTVTAATTTTTTELCWKHLLAGGIAGAASRTCTAPLDRVKVFFQINPNKEKLGPCFRNLIVEGGVCGLWRGNGINVLKIAPETALKFAAYEQIKRLILDYEHDHRRHRNHTSASLSVSERFVAGAAAGAFSQSVIYPLEVLKTRLALRKTGQYRTISEHVRKIYQLQGLRGFYRGYVPNIIGIVPYGGIDLAVYETLKREYLKRHANLDKPSIIAIVICGGISSSLGQICSYPLSLIRTRLQASDSCERISIIRILRQIVKQNGFTGLYRGLLPNFIKVIPAVSISYIVYENTSQCLGIKMS